MSVASAEVADMPSVAAAAAPARVQPRTRRVITALPPLCFLLAKWAEHARVARRRSGAVALRYLSVARDSSPMVSSRYKRNGTQKTDEALAHLGRLVDWLSPAGAW